MTHWPPGDGEMAERIRALDWSATPLGPVEGWPHSLRVATRLLLSSRHPMFIWWGPELIQLYNDAYRETMGWEKHPSALGGRGRDTWTETWDVIGPQIARVMGGGPASWHEDQLLPVTRHGGREDAWWTYGFSPIHDEAAPDGVGGVMVICQDVTREHLTRAAVVESEEKYRTLFQTMNEGFGICELLRDDTGRAVDFRFLEVNSAFEKQTGMGRESWVGRTCGELFPAEPRGYWLGVYGDVVETQAARTFEDYWAPLNRWFAGAATPLGGQRFSVAFTEVSERKRAEMALRDSEARYQALFAASPVPLMVLDPNPPDFTVTAANEALYAATLTTREGLIGRRLFDVFSDDPTRPGPLGSQALALSLHRVLATRRADVMGRVRYDIAVPGGFEPHWWEATNAPMTDAAGRVVAIIHQVNRVTELHFAEEAERRHRARQAFLLKLNDALRPLADAEAVRRTAAQILGEHLGVNRAFYGEVDGDDWVVPGDYERGIVRLTPGRFAAETYGSWMMDSYREGGIVEFSDVRVDPRFNAAERQAMTRFEIIAALGVGLVKEGRLVAILGVHSGTPRTWTAEEISLLSGTAERTWAAIERAKVEEALRESESRFAQFAASSSDALWIRDAGTLEMEYVSPAVEPIYGVSPETLLDGTPNWTALIVPEDRAASLTHLEQARGGEATVHEFRIRRPSDGATRWIRDTGFPLHDARGRVQRIGGIAQDITGARLATERQGVLVAELQHRTRNLIAVVKGIANDTMRETGPTPAFRAAFSDRLSALSRVQGLLSRSEAEPITIGSLLRLELDALGAGAAGDRVTAAGPEVELRPSTVQTLALALHELATNARKHGALSHEDGRLAVTWRKRSEDGERRLAIDWVETGLERALPRPAAERGEGGYGRELIERALPHALGARTSYALAASGVRCTIDLAVRPGKGEP